MTRWTGPAEDVEARACPAAKPRAHLTPHPADRAPAPPALATGVLAFLRTLRSGPARVVTRDRGGEHPRQDRDPAVRTPNRPPTLIGLHCQVCGYLSPVKGRRQVPAPVCAGSKAKTGKPHAPTPVRRTGTAVLDAEALLHSVTALHTGRQSLSGVSAWRTRGA